MKTQSKLKYARLFKKNRNLTDYLFQVIILICAFVWLSGINTNMEPYIVAIISFSSICDMAFTQIDNMSNQILDKYVDFDNDEQ
ncbi:hypothetical protein ACEV9E_16845 [Vibrio parahaemolyticus]|nr:hypothetical protein [Vibrio parahaemolyticus]EJE8524492.1 hypothetical protein [Vibrio parahaemolyticus]ELS9501205.1 hypothetical protein [Vibrio parahaemolyticus]MDF5571338.1 hypothetical protein [Vibrio parahaemolyticus]MDG2899629.1 hypothetical protein [Vibrio parahaemolyticus]